MRLPLVPLLKEKILCLRRPLLLLAADVLGVLGLAILVGLFRTLLFPHEAEAFFRLLPLLAIAPIFFYIEGLYNHVMPPFPQELRRIGIGISVAYLAMGLMLFLMRAEELPSRSAMVLTWLLSMGLTPYLRVLVRRRFASRPWWGKDVILFGRPEAVSHLTHFLRFSPETGLRPAAVVCHGESTGPESIILATVQRLTDMQAVEAYADAHKRSYAIILAEAYTAAESRELMEHAGRLFPSVFLMVGYLAGEMPLWLQPVEIAHTMTLQMRQNLFDPRRLLLKRMVDVIAALIGGILLLPVFVGLAIWIKADSPGPVFFAHQRLGLGGRHFKMYKFRTMVRDADAVLQAYLDTDPELRREWEADQKLRNDPRITRVGAWLRRLSLDELPQVWNVLKGDMSLVGPRPIVDSEIDKYGKAYGDYVRVRPGMTGLWQVSGRNDTSYAYRVSIDNYYICNWSVWMDLWVLARTPLVVVHGAGAY